MLNEPASSSRQNGAVSRAPVKPIADPLDSQRLEVRQAVGTVLAIDMEYTPETDSLPDDAMLLVLAHRSQLIASFEGRLLLDSETAYNQLDALLAPYNQLALFREEDGKHVIYVIGGRADPQPRPWWPNLLLFIATIFSVLVVGMSIAFATDTSAKVAIQRNGIIEMWRGWPYAVSILLILGAHEMGHYFAARRHRLAVTLPYFIPLPFLSPLGTLGAFIQLRQPFRNRKVLLDVGASGPLAGLFFAIPILLIGLANTPLQTPASMQRSSTYDQESSVYEGDSVIYALSKIITYGHFVPDGERDVCINCNQLAWAGWTGLLVTALNLVPVGQLDGGHILYAILGKRARYLYYPIMGIMIALTLFVSSTWLIWVMLLLFMGRLYAAPLDTITPLDSPRRVVAVASVILFVLIFVPAPLAPAGGGGLISGIFAMGLMLPTLAPAIWWRLKH